MDYDLSAEGIEDFHSIYKRLSSYLVEKEANDRIVTLEVVNEELSDHKREDDLDIQLAPTALDDTPPKVRDPTEKINLGTIDEPMEVAISAYLEPSEKQRLADLLLEFKDCFAKKYKDMPGLSPELVSHQLPTLPDKRPVKQEPRRMNAETQKNGKMRVCVDYRDLNLATPKDVYPMPVADMLVDAVVGHELLPFMDGTAGYHQIPVAEEDMHKTAFWCPGFGGIFEYVVMPFGLKNAGAIYQRAMNLIFHDILGKILEVYIDDVVVKSRKIGDHIADLRKRGIEVPEDKGNAVINASPPRTKKELQRLLGKIQPFSPLLKLQGQNEFVWEPKHQEAFERIKNYLASPPVLVPPRPEFPLKLYVSAADAPIGSLLAQDDEGGIEHAIFYLSRTLTDCETRYTPMEKLCLTLYFSACKLRHYMLSFTTCIISQTDLVKYVLSRTILRGRIGKWVLALSEFSLQYVPQKAVKGQTIADFLAHHPMLDLPATKELEIASATAMRLDLARIPEYVALIIGLEVLLELGVRDVQVRGDSQLVINQLQEKYRCVSWLLVPYLNRTIELLDQFDDADLEYIPRERNFAAIELAQLATIITLKYGVRERILKVERRTLPSWLARPDPLDEPVVTVLEPIDVDWRILLIDYLKRPDPTADKKMRFLALNYFLKGDELRQRGEDDIDFRCVYGREAKRLMSEAHTGICRAHQEGPKMRWLIRRHGYYWPSILKDCIAFAKGCEDCQAHGPVQHVPNIPMQPIIKPWPARGWALDLIGMIHPHSSLQHKFIIVATDFFTKWVEAEPLKEASGNTIRQFIFRNILYRFGIPEVLVSDRGAEFMGGPVEQLVNDFGIQFLHSTPYYAQSNGQAEASNKIIITLLKKMLVENHRQWHDTLYETLWAYRTYIQAESHRYDTEHEDLSEQRLAALDNLVMEKQRIARAYDKRTRGRSYKEGELVWKAFLPLGEKLTGCDQHGYICDYKAKCGIGKHSEETQILKVVESGCGKRICAVQLALFLSPPRSSSELSRRCYCLYRRKREGNNPSYPSQEVILRVGDGIQSERDSQPHLPPGEKQKPRSRAPEVDRGGRKVGLKVVFCLSASCSTRTIGGDRLLKMWSCCVRSMTCSSV
ncbi:uncharacterized protein LOC121051315 [Rosa chinensis]|uniref:uncharacterized protein LOC121051315 n=1 Tax=Rosa chinensis TaxID=74649 RepID=UPI001AD8CF89|nr:uncharacterized protein LOC121051315 [Rosa chinensis]